jgi:esterase/lipase superfamily enzyme
VKKSSSKSLGKTSGRTKNRYKGKVGVRFLADRRGHLAILEPSNGSGFYPQPGRGKQALYEKTGMIRGAGALDTQGIHVGVESIRRTPSNAKSAGAIRQFEVIDVFYATDREPKYVGTSGTNIRYLNRIISDYRELSYGICGVTIPPGHNLGKIESPSIWKFEIHEDPEKHFTISGCSIRSSTAFFTDIQSRIHESNGHSCFVFIHGYNVSFEDAAKRTAQLACDLKFVGVPILYSWSSAADWRRYPKDVESVEMTIDHLTAFFTRLVQSSGAKDVHLIAHSMGNRALVKALKQMTARRSKKLFKQVVLTAPDVPRQRVEPLIKAAGEKAERVTLYASSKDKALGLSRVKNEYERLGKVYGYPFVFEGMDSVDASTVNTDFWGHSAFAKTRTVLGDLATLITDGHPPSKRFGLKKVKSPNGISWSILP